MAEHIADKIGSPLSILIHTILFIVNLAGLFFYDATLVLLVLTTWVSLEAIYLALFTQLVVTNEKKRRDEK
jgi:ABC-type bacteriocin/lantibiotic exporter with double-glycine peptidase domain